MKAQAWDGYKVCNFETMDMAKRFAKSMVFMTGETWYVGKASENFPRYKLHATKEFAITDLYKVKIEKLEVE